MCITPHASPQTIAMTLLAGTRTLDLFGTNLPGKTHSFEWCLVLHTKVLFQNRKHFKIWYTPASYDYATFNFRLASTKSRIFSIVSFIATQSGCPKFFESYVLVRKQRNSVHHVFNLGN